MREGGDHQPAVEALEPRRLMAAGAAAAAAGVETTRGPLSPAVTRHADAATAPTRRVDALGRVARRDANPATPAPTIGSVPTAGPTRPVGLADAVAPRAAAASFDARLGRQALTVTFTEDVAASLASADLFVADAATGAAAPFALHAYAANVATFVPAGGAPLADGSYRAALRGSGVADAAGNTLGDGDVVLAFAVLPGDADGDRSVGLPDFSRLAANYGKTGQASWADGDFDGDGAVGLTDFSLLSSRYGRSAAPASTLPPDRLRVDAGAAAASTDALNRKFDRDAGFAGGTAAQSDTYDVANVLGADDALFLTYRTGTDFSFARPVANGRYSLWLEFAEPTIGAAAAARVFDVSAEGAVVLDDYNVTADAGGPRAAAARQVNVTVTDGWLDLSFYGVVGEAIVSAIVLLPTDVPAAALPYAGLTGSSDPATQAALEQRWLTGSQTNLRRIGLGLQNYANDHKGRFPATLVDAFGNAFSETLAGYANPRAATLVPRGETSTLEDVAWVARRSDYVYVGAGLNFTAPSTAIVAFEDLARVQSDTIATLFADGHVAQVTRAQIVAQFGGAAVAPPPPLRPLDAFADPASAASASNLSRIGVDMNYYSLDRRRRLPPDLGTLVETMNTPADRFVNPRGASPETPPPGMTREQAAAWVDEQDDYVFTAAGRDAGRYFSGRDVIVHENPVEVPAGGLWLLFGDAHVEFRETAWASETLARPRP